MYSSTILSVVFLFLCFCQWVVLLGIKRLIDWLHSVTGGIQSFTYFSIEKYLFLLSNSSKSSEESRDTGGAENAGVEKAAPSSRGGKRGEIGRPKKKWNMLNDKRIKACMKRCDNGAYSLFSSWWPWDTQWVLTLKHCVPQRITAVAAMRMRRLRRQRQRQTRHYDMILWLCNLVVDFC